MGAMTLSPDVVSPGVSEQISLVEWHAAARPYTGEAISGDLQVVAFYPGGVLAAAIDGLGHGAEAAMAAAAAASVLQQWPEAPVTDLMNRCHAALRSTRGAVISLASFDAASATVTWLGVGNVAGILLRRDPSAKPAREGLISRGGVVGFRLPPLRAAGLAIGRGDLLVLATDGIRSDFHHSLTADGSVKAIATDILLSHGRTNDDALVLAVRWTGGPA
jgi:phosphoserine phosphatase RsbX